MMEDLEEQPSKRRRLDETQRPPTGINSPEELHKLLQFQQTITPGARSAINSFKDFLSEIKNSENLPVQSKGLQILRRYCNNQTAASKDELDFPDLLSTWSLAAQSSNDAICSAIPAALAQFYKTISSILEFREFGLSLGHTLLKRDQVRLLERGLSAPKNREHLISPCLRLLTEVISFDGGALASRVFDRRDTLFKRLDFLLDQNSVAPPEDRRGPTVRRMALRLMIATLKFLDTNSKIEFVTHGRIFRNCIRGLPMDGDDIVVDILKSFEVALIDDRTVPRASKSRIFHHDNLVNLTALYDYEEDSDHPGAASRVRDTVQNLLLKICTTRSGILLPQSGYYPPSIDPRPEADPDDDYIDLGLDAISHDNELNAKVSIRNSTLLQFSIILKPETDTLQSALILQIMRAAPEIVAEYFGGRPKFAILSSDDPTWRNYFAFLFSVSQLPIPRNLGWQEGMPSNPPPISNVIENVLPGVLDRTTLAKYLTSNEDMLMLSATRLLTIVLQKIQHLLQQFSGHSNSEQWIQASQRLIEVALQRVPKLQEMVNCLQRASKDDGPLRVALFECLSLYHQVLPEATINSKFDFTTTLTDLLAQVVTSVDATTATTQTQIKEIMYLAKIAESSAVTKWWSKPDPDSMSLYSQLLRFATTSIDDEASTSILEILRSAASTSGFFASNILSFMALQLSVESTKKFEAAPGTWLLLDNAIHRAIQRPVQFLDLVESIQHTVSDRKPLSILAAAVAEQWEYVLKRYDGQKDVLKNIAEWISRFYSALESVGENFRVMHQLQDGMLQRESRPKEILQKALEKHRKKPMVVEHTTTETGDEHNQLAYKDRIVDLSEILGLPSPEIQTFENVGRWDDKTDVQLALSSGKLDKLFRCATSVDEVRRQSFSALQQAMHVINQSTYDEKAQTYLLLGQFTHTVSQHGLETPLPCFAAELAVQLLHIVTDPAHRMYGKVNKFLLRSPTWDLKRLTSYWVREILYQEPEGDDASAWTSEVEWLIQWHVDALKSDVDMEVYRRSGVYERFLTLYMKPGLARSTKKLILTMIWRGICVGGTNTLITRVGIRCWLQMAQTIDKDHNNIIQQLQKEIADRCSTELISTWEDDLPVLRSRS